MAGWFRSLLCCSFLLLALCLDVAEARSGCNITGFTCLDPMIASHKNGKNKGSAASTKDTWNGFRPAGRGFGGDLVGSGLKWVPSGPDPMHHNGSPNPKKPQNP